MITEQAFLKLFSRMDRQLTQDFSFFLKNARVRSGKNLRTIVEYAKEKKIPKDVLRLLYENIQKKNDYLSRFYYRSLYYDKADISIREPPMKNKNFNNNALVKYKNAIRNMFFYEILRDTKSGFNNPSFFTALDELFNHLIIDIRLLSPWCHSYIREGRISSLYGSMFFRASIMNPYLVYSLNKTVFSNAKRVFTPTLGWSSYFYGFAESGIEEYVATDVIPSVCSKTARFAEKYYPRIKTDIYCVPSEQLAKTGAFMRKYNQYFDVIFFSPPYFKLEQYPGNKQSTVLYETLEEWLEKYWEETIKMCAKVLRRDGILCYILSDYGSVNTTHYTLLKDMNDITKRFFSKITMQPMYNKNVDVTAKGHRETDEQIMIFKF